MRLAKARYALQQHIASRDDCQQQVFHHLRLADHFLCDLCPDLFILSRELLHRIHLLTHVFLSFLPIANGLFLSIHNDELCIMD